MYIYIIYILCIRYPFCKCCKAIFSISSNWYMVEQTSVATYPAKLGDVGKNVHGSCISSGTFCYSNNSSRSEQRMSCLKGNMHPDTLRGISSRKKTFKKFNREQQTDASVSHLLIIRSGLLHKAEWHIRMVSRYCVIEEANWY